MNIQGILIIVVIAFVAVFAIANWGILTTPAAVSLLFTSVQAPVGMIMLGAMALLAVLFLAYLLFLQTALVREQRRHAKTLQAQRDQADKAEAGRFDAMRTYLDGELKGLEGRLQTHLSTSDATTRRELTDLANTVAAYLASIDDKLGDAVRGRVPGEPPRLR